MPMESRDLIRGRDWFADAAIVGMFDVVVVVDDEVSTSAIERRSFSHDVIDSDNDGINA